MNYEIYYIESTVVSIIILLMLLFNAMRSADTQMHKRYLASCVCFESLYLIIDVIWTLTEDGPTRHIIVSNVLLYMIMNIMAYTMFQYWLSLQGRVCLLESRIQLLMYIPAFINLVMIFTTPFTHLFFYVEDGRGPVTGPLYYLMISLAMVYLVAACLLWFLAAFLEDNYADRMLNVTRGLAYLPTIVSGILQSAFIHIPFVCFGIVISMLLLYMSSMSSYISLDPLTQINNRNQFRRHLGNKLRDNGNLALIIMDIDRFKSINDTYGHLEGDEALIRVAKALKLICSSNRSKYSISRYGGDEFVVLVYGTYDEAAKTCVQIQKTLSELGREANAEYSLTLSFGIACKGPDTSTIPSIFAAADKKLYVQKQIKHNART